MIKANDLRPGNIIRHTVHGIIAIEGVWSQKVKDGNYETVYYNKEWHLLGHCAPIELTPEILGKIRDCEKIYDGTYTTTWDIAFRDLRYICVTYAKPDNTWSVTLSSTIVMKQPTLHWLQNIIYYNWGQDLEITL